MGSESADRGKGRVLVVDDDVDLLSLLEAGLEHGGYEVEVCGSAERALELLEVSPFDVVVTDINLPGMSGLDFCSRVVSERSNSLAVLVMTAFSSIKSAVAALRAGAYDYLMKPLDVDALVHRLDRFREEDVAHASGREPPQHAIPTDPDPMRCHRSPRVASTRPRTERGSPAAPGRSSTTIGPLTHPAPTTPRRHCDRSWAVGRVSVSRS